MCTCYIHTVYILYTYCIHVSIITVWQNCQTSMQRQNYQTHFHFVYIVNVAGVQKRSRKIFFIKNDLGQSINCIIIAISQYLVDDRQVKDDIGASSVIYLVCDIGVLHLPVPAIRKSHPMELLCGIYSDMDI